jgi:hypothetical protein
MRGVVTGTSLQLLLLFTSHQRYVSSIVGTNRQGLFFEISNLLAARAVD